METVITSPTRQVHIGPGLPFVIVGERINPTGRSKLGVEMAAGDFTRVRQDALAQVAAGAHILDINAGIPLADEPGILAEAIRIVQAIVETPLSIDSSIVAALEAGLKAYRGKPLVNSVTGEDERLDAVLPMVKEYGAVVIGVSNDDTGISEDPAVRFAVAKKIVERAESYGIPRQDVLIDPLAMPIGAVARAGLALFEIVRRVREELGVNTICGASNISFGLPDRLRLNATFLTMAMAAGLTAAITNPLEEEIRLAIMAGNVMCAQDENCQAWLQAHRGDSGAGFERAARRARRRAARSETT
jgi:5-methyltetrahydrofolate--homocysteine methyltransferase